MYVPSNKSSGINEIDTDPKKVANENMCFFTFFHEKIANIKKNNFSKSPQNGQIGKLLLSVSAMETKSRSIKMVIIDGMMYLVDKYV